MLTASSEPTSTQTINQAGVSIEGLSLLFLSASAAGDFYRILIRNLQLHYKSRELDTYRHATWFPSLYKFAFINEVRIAFGHESFFVLVLTGRLRLVEVGGAIFCSLL